MDMRIEMDWAPLPDGDTVPHRAEAAEAAVAWDDGQRLAKVKHRLAQFAYIGCMILTFLLITIGTATHPSP